MGHVQARRFSAVSLLALLTLTSTSAQAQSALSGIVHDPTSRVAVGAVVIIDDNVGGRWEGTSNAIGYYEIYLPPGEYNVEAYLDLDSGQQLSYIGGVLVLPNENQGLDITLEYRNVERVTVASTPSSGALLPADSALGETFTREAIDTLPLSNGRTLQSLLSLVPGIVFTETTGTLAQFTTIGQRRFSNRLVIDGIDADLAIDVRGQGIGTAASGVLPAFASTGGTQTLVPLAAVEEIQVRTTNAPAAQLRTPGAQTTIVTRAGVDRFTGTLFTDRRPAALGASDWLTNASGAPHRRIESWSAGSSIGGPLWPRRVFSFVAWEHERVDRPLAMTMSVPTLALRASAPTDTRALLNAFPLPNGPDRGAGLADLSVLVPATSALSTVSTRVDARVTAAHQVFARVNRGTSGGDALLDLRQEPIPGYTNTEATTTTTATVGQRSVWTSLVHDLRVNATEHRGSLIAGPARYAGAQPLPLGVLAPADTDAWVRVNLFAGPGGAVTNGVTGASSQTQAQVVDTWTWLRGRHEWQFGADVRQLTADSHPALTRYTYRFSNAPALLQGPPRFVTVDQLQPARAQTTSWAVFVQDSVRLSPRLSVSYGLRASGQPAPSSTTPIAPLVFEADALPQLEVHQPAAPLWHANAVTLSPRVSAIRQLVPTAGRETALRAGWSLVHDEATPSGAVAFGRGYPYVATTVLRPSTFPVAPADVAAIPPLAPFESTPIAEAFAFPAHLQTPWTQQWSLGLDRALGRSQQLSVAYVGTAGRHLPYAYTQFLDTNHPIQVVSDAATADYHALLVEFVRHAARHVDARVAYTWSHAIDLDSGEAPDANLPPTIAAPGTNRGSADFDRRHVLRALLSYRVPALRTPRVVRPILEGWQFDAIGMLISGAPVTVALPEDLANGTYTLRADVVPNVPVWLKDPQSPTGRIINAAAFRAPADRQGMLGRNTLHASTLRQVDVALSRSIRLGARVVAQGRVDAFNVFNVPNFGPPNAKLDRSPFGQPIQTYAEDLGTGTLSNGGLVPLQQVGGPRSIRFCVRLGW